MVRALVMATFLLSFAVGLRMCLHLKRGAPGSGPMRRAGLPGGFPAASPDRVDGGQQKSAGGEKQGPRRPRGGGKLGRPPKAPGRMTHVRRET